MDWRTRGLNVILKVFMDAVHAKTEDDNVIVRNPQKIQRAQELQGSKARAKKASKKGVC
jgi:hypothetical protein